ncbi:2Fe-2S iron-sulfur cluster-binding protein [Marinobacterium aestuariivivens]|uniref:2Fe-2S iron-sulfur cluster-binding protein n=1 Tax=Marinobacterium aestuariivivens TaxID=1698799 RepID=A0ABW1ZVZ9_9GAMM
MLHQTEDPYRDRAAGGVKPAPLSKVSSRGGYCGCCKVRLIDGEVEMVQDSLLDLPEGEILTCCTKPKTHIEIELPEE